MFYYQCLDDKSLIKSFQHEQPTNASVTDTTVDASLLRRLCPVFLYQLVAPTSVERQGCILTTNGVTDAQVGEARLADSHHHRENHNSFAGTFIASLNNCITEYKS